MGESERMSGEDGDDDDCLLDIMFTVVIMIIAYWTL
jgi:hypothetical protein